MTLPDDQIFSPGDKVVRIPNWKPARNPAPESECPPRQAIRDDRVYCVSDCWETSIGWQLWLVGDGPTPVLNGFKTGYATRNFRKVAEVGHPSFVTQQEHTV